MRILENTWMRLNLSDRLEDKNYESITHDSGERIHPKISERTGENVGDRKI